MKTEISIRLALHTQFGPCGPRLERGTKMPVQTFDFPDTPEGRADAEQAKEALQKYIDTHHGRNKK